MGGFMFRGCGAADSFYTLRPLPGHTCRSCKKGEYALMEVRRKVRVFYIPTVSVNTKYAIACQKCKLGYYITEKQKSMVLAHGPECVEVKADGVEFHLPEVAELPVNNIEVTMESQVVEDTKPLFETYEAEVKIEPETEIMPETNVITQVKTLQEKQNIYPDSSIKSQTFSYQRGKICPECGMRSVANRETCAICGAKL